MNSSKAHSLLRSLNIRAVIRVCCLLALLQCFALHALTLTWRAPESGPEVAGYYIYMREASSETFSKIDVGNVTSYVVNDLVPGRTYVFYATAFNQYGLESDPSNTYTYEPQDQPEAFVTTLLAREALLLDSDVILHQDPLAYGGLPTSPTEEYLVALNDNKGWAHFHPMLPAAGQYAIWCRVLAPDPDSDSFNVAINGKSMGVFEAGFAAPVWQWTRLTTRNPVNPQQIQSTFSFRESVNEISFGGREANVHLAQLLITNDPHFVPAEVAASRRSEERRVGKEWRTRWAA